MTHVSYLGPCAFILLFFILFVMPHSCYSHTHATVNM